MNNAEEKKTHISRLLLLPITNQKYIEAYFQVDLPGWKRGMRQVDAACGDFQSMNEDWKYQQCEWEVAFQLPPNILQGTQPADTHMSVTREFKAGVKP